MSEQERSLSNVLAEGAEEMWTVTWEMQTAAAKLEAEVAAWKAAMVEEIRVNYEDMYRDEALDTAIRDARNAVARGMSVYEYGEAGQEEQDA